MENVLRPRHYGLINYYGLWTLYLKEVRRFTSISLQTVIAPVMTTLLFLVIFMLAFKQHDPSVNTSHSYILFLAPGLIAMSMVQNAFANSASSLTAAKVQGSIIDVLLPPISPGEFVFAYAMASVTRGLTVGFFSTIIISFFVPLHIASLPTILAFAILGSLMLGLLGVIGGIWAVKFDHIATISNFIIMPLSFLSGTFYSIHNLPEPFQTIAWCDPFFYMIDGFRSGFTGQGDAPAIIGLTLLLIIDIALWFGAWRMVKTGYRLKA